MYHLYSMDKNRIITYIIILRISDNNTIMIYIEIYIIAKIITNDKMQNK